MLLNSKKSLQRKVLTFKCFSKMTKRDLVVASTRHHHARFLKYYPRRHCAPSLIKSRFFPHTILIYLQYLLSLYILNSLYVYTRGILGWLLGFWLLGQNPAGAKIFEKLCIKKCSHFTTTRVKSEANERSISFVTLSHDSKCQ